MATYRLYRLDGSDRIGSAAVPVHAEDDDAAVAAARELSHGKPCELWLGNRRIARINADN